MIFKDYDRIVFAGDSITDMGSVQPVGDGSMWDNLGKSYVRIVDNMLAAYYSKGADSGQMFSGLKISKDADFRKHLNKYDVLHIDIQWFLANCEDADKVVSFITKSVLDELRDIYPEVLSQDVVTFPDALSRVKECTG